MSNDAEEYRPEKRRTFTSVCSAHPVEPKRVSDEVAWVSLNRVEFCARQIKIKFFSNKTMVRP